VEKADRVRTTPLYREAQLFTGRGALVAQAIEGYFIIAALIFLLVALVALVDIQALAEQGLFNYTPLRPSRRWWRWGWSSKSLRS
jgi:hypothetical protein